MHTCMHVCMYIQYILVHIHTYAYKYMYIYTHAFWLINSTMKFEVCTYERMCPTANIQYYMYICWSLRPEVRMYVRVADLCTYVRVADLCTYVRVADLCTYVRVADLCTYVRVADLCTYVRGSRGQIHERNRDRRNGQERRVKTQTNKSSARVGPRLYKQSGNTLHSTTDLGL
jgi:hypothetical protein